MQLWPFKKPCSPPPDRVKEAAPAIAARERTLAELRLKREAVEKELALALGEITRPKRNE